MTGGRWCNGVPVGIASLVTDQIIKIKKSSEGDLHIRGFSMLYETSLFILKATSHEWLPSSDVCLLLLS